MRTSFTPLFIGRSDQPAAHLRAGERRERHLPEFARELAGLVIVGNGEGVQRLSSLMTSATHGGRSNVVGRATSSDQTLPTAAGCGRRQSTPYR